MYFFRPPQSNASFPLVALPILGHMLSFHVFRAYLLLDMYLRFNRNIDELRNVTYIFDTVYYIFFGFGAFFMELIPAKFGLILLLIAVSVIAQIFFYLSTMLYMAEIAYIIVAGLASTIKIGLVAYGAAEYTGVNCLYLLPYFIINYIVEMIGYFMALRFVKLHMLIDNVCGSVKCSSYVMTVTIFFEMFAWFTFNFCNSSVTKISKTPISVGLAKMGRILFVFLPFLVVFFDYGEGIWRWVAQAKFMKCQFLWYKLNLNDMLTVDLIAVILCGLVFLFFTCSKCIVRCPALIIILGGSLMSAAIILSAYNYDTLQVYDKPKLSTNMSWLYFGGDTTGICNLNGTLVHVDAVAVDIYIDWFQIHFDKMLFKSLDWNLEGGEACLDINLFFETNKLKIIPIQNYTACLKDKSSYIFHLGCNSNAENPSHPTLINLTKIFNVILFDDSRDLYGRPKLCILSSLDASLSDYHITFQSVDSPNARYLTMARDNFICHKIEEGQYDFIVNKSILEKDLNFRYGGVYLVHATEQKTSSDNEFIVIRHPLETPMWYLLIIIYLAAFGKNCVIATGMYVIYTQSPINVRTIAIGCWCLFISSGNFVFTISGATGLPEKMNSFIFTGELIGLMTILFLIGYICYGQWNFKCDTVLTTDEKENELPLLLADEGGTEPPLPPESQPPDALSIQLQPPLALPPPLVVLKPPVRLKPRNKSYLTVEYRHRKY